MTPQRSLSRCSCNRLLVAVVSGGLQGGESQAKWGIILGWISVAISVIAMIIVLIAFLGS